MSESVTFSVHPSAAKAFNDRADGILSSLEPALLRRGQAPTFRPNVHVKAHLAEKDFASPILVSQVDYRGRQVAKHFQHAGKIIAVQGDGFQQLVSLAEQIQKAEAIRAHISVECLIERGFEWLRSRYKGETSEAFTAYVLREAGALVRDVEIWFPLHRVYLESEIKLGRTTFKTLTQSMLDQWIGQLPNDLPMEQRAAVEADFDRTRSMLQGCAAATMRVLAEPIRAQETSSEEAERSIAALRFFHPANITPYARAYCTKSGQENAGITRSVVVEGGAITRWNESSDAKTGLMWSVSNSEIDLFREGGLDRLSQLLGKEEKSLFQKDLLDAFLIYNRNSLTNHPADRLIYILAAVESILLRDRSESIQNNLADRLAFLAGPTLETRIAVRKRVIKTYDLRSRFLHHGRTFTEMEELEKFMRDVWNAFAVLIQNLDRFGTKQELIDALDRRKMA